MPSHTYRPFDESADREALLRVLTHAFGGPDDDWGAWLEYAGPCARVIAEDGRIRGGLALYPMAHWFGGRSVPARGVAAVGIDAADRGRGVGTRLMAEAVREIHGAGVALSALYPAVQSLYRRAGYERAGHLFVTDLLLRRIAPVDRSLALRKGTPDDEPLLERLADDVARRHDGNVDRSPLMWRRARAPQGKPAEVHVVEEEGAVTGYIRTRFEPGAGGRRVGVPDVVATTRGAARRLLAFLADHSAQIERARCLRGPADALLTAADSLCSETRVVDVWMLRIAHVENALASRGYAPGLRAEVHLELDDDLCPGNTGRWLLRVEDGAATVERGGAGRVRLHVRDLAPIYSGFQHPLVARTCRAVDGSDADLRTLGAVFAANTPWMQDAF